MNFWYLLIAFGVGFAVGDCVGTLACLLALMRKQEEPDEGIEPPAPFEE